MLFDAEKANIANGDSRECHLQRVSISKAVACVSRLTDHYSGGGTDRLIVLTTVGVDSCIKEMRSFGMIPNKCTSVSTLV